MSTEVEQKLPTLSDQIIPKKENEGGCKKII